MLLAVAASRHSVESESTNRALVSYSSILEGKSCSSDHIYLSPYFERSQCIHHHSTFYPVWRWGLMSTEYSFEDLLISRSSLAKYSSSSRTQDFCEEYLWNVTNFIISVSLITTELLRNNLSCSIAQKTWREGCKQRRNTKQSMQGYVHFRRVPAWSLFEIWNEFWPKPEKRRNRKKKQKEIHWLV